MEILSLFYMATKDDCPTLPKQDGQHELLCDVYDEAAIAIELFEQLMFVCIFDVI